MIFNDESSNFKLNKKSYKIHTIGGPIQNREFNLEDYLPLLNLNKDQLCAQRLKFTKHKNINEFLDSLSDGWALRD